MINPVTPNSSAFPEISGYTLTELLYDGSRAAVYRAVQNSSQRVAIVKLLRAAYPSFNELLQFRNQYAVALNLDLPGIVRPLSLEPYRNGYALVMDDDGSLSLDRYQNGQPLSVLATLDIARQLAEILHHLHAKRVIHKDIKPANILIHPETHRVKLIDFSISSLLPRETQELENPNVLEGTLAYIAPEQTGRMNRAIDYRADYYSLGVTLYELLTGQLPFQGEEPLELVHCHLAREPVAPQTINSEIPIALSNIILKLMAKNAEDRYQSALGLKADLEGCWQQWQKTGNIIEFELDRQSFNDRFTITEKLYGREGEVARLLAAFERVSRRRRAESGGASTSLGAGSDRRGEQPLIANSELLLVAGYSGIGKTAVINEIHKPIIRQKGYFIKGKFEQFQKNIPLTAFVRAFDSLIQQLLSEPEETLRHWRRKILAAVGENGKVLTELIPELEKIIGEQPPVLELSGVADRDRFNSLFQNFVRLFSRPEHPLVLFLDDLQWADSASLGLLKLLLEDTSYLLILGAYRDNEVTPAHPLMLTLAEIEQMGANVEILTLSPLSETALNRFVADTLNCESAIAQPLTALVYQKTQGNPFFATQFLKALHDEKLIFPKASTEYEKGGGWQCDLTQIAALATTDNVVEFMASQLQKLPPKTQKLLELAACIGARFDLKTLSIISEESIAEAAAGLWSALQEGSILPTANLYKFFLPSEGESTTVPSVNPTYQFLHDRVQQAAYFLIPAEERQTTHLRIGRLLQKELSENAREENLFDLLEHLNRSCEFITEPEERVNLAQLNLVAGRRARNATAYESANQYFQIGLDLLPIAAWETQYELTLDLSVAAAEVAYLKGDFDRLENFANAVLRSAKTPLDKATIYELQIDARTAKSEMLQALEIGISALQEFGIELPTQPDSIVIATALQTLVQLCQQQEIEKLIDLPSMTDPTMSAVMQLLKNTIGAAMQGVPALLPLLSVKMVELTLEFGNAPSSILGYAIAGMVLSTFLDEVEMGYRLGKLALNLIERLGLRELKSSTIATFTLFIQHRKESFRATLPLVKEGYLSGLETGNFLGAGYNLASLVDSYLFAAVPLKDWADDIEDYCRILERVNQKSPSEYLRLKQRYVQNLQEVLDRPDSLIGNLYDETIKLPECLKDGDYVHFFLAKFYKLQLAFIFNNYAHSETYIKEIKDNIKILSGMLVIPTFHFYAALNELVVLAPQKGNPCPAENSATGAAFDRVAAHQAIVAKWADDAPMNYRHKVTLIEAEKYRVLGQNAIASEYYDRAIAGAREQQYHQDEGIACERTARFYDDWGKEPLAESYLQQAYNCYAKWGATAKLAQLEKKYPQIFSQDRSQLAARETLDRSQRNRSQASSSENLRLDFVAVLTAAQAISQEIQLDPLIDKLLQIATAIAGAERGVLVIERAGEWFVVAKAIAEKTEHLELPLARSRDLPKALLYSVLRTPETAVFDDLSRVEKFARDPYILTHLPKSALALPIEKQGQPIGLLYLENNLIANAFSRDRVQTLQILAAQAAISLENARLYQQVDRYSHTLEAEVERKTEALSQKAIALEQTLHKLQRTQSQLIQSEKMSALGQLVAGIAHEINNPISFILGNITHTENYFNKLLEVLEIYERKAPEASETIPEELEEIEFVREDFPQILRSMQTGSERIKQIVLSLRNFSRLDEAEIKSVDLHVGIESTLLLLRNRLQATEKRPEIQIRKNYGNLPEVTCYASEMNQVFLSLLSNALDACLDAKEPTIEITSETLESKGVKIAIADNGVGIPAENLERIFDPFFTTKPVGSGTGLGLTVSYAIVKKHGGQLTCRSTPERGSIFIIEIPARV